MTPSEILPGVVPVLRRGARWSLRRAAYAVGNGRPVHLRGEVGGPGWYRSTGFGSEARVRASLTDDEVRQVLDALPARRGHHWRGRIVQDDGSIEVVRFAPEGEDLEVLVPLVARFWAPSVLAFDRTDMDDLPEVQVRDAVLQGRGISEVVGVRASLRVAAALALLDRSSHALLIPFSPPEVCTRLREVAAGGAPAAERVLNDLQVARRVALREAQAATPAPRRPVASAPTPAPPQRGDDLTGRVAASLAKSGAVLLNVRRTGGGQVQVLWSFRGGNFSSIADGETLNIVDAGVCLAGTQGRFTLDSLPSVIREASDTNRLVVTRHAHVDGRFDTDSSDDYDEDDDY